MRLQNNAYGLLVICSVTSEPNDGLAAEARVMKIPAAIDINRDGTCDARPSPIVNTVYFETASPILHLIHQTSNA